MKRIFMLLGCALLLCGCENSEAKNEASARRYVVAMDEYAQGDLDSTVVICDEILKTNKGFYQAEYLKAKACFFDNQLEVAANSFRKLLTRHPEYTDARIWLIRTMISQGLFGDAINEIEIALTWNADDWRLYHLFSIAADGLGQIDMKMEMLGKARAHVEESVKIYVDQAHMYYSFGRLEDARESLDMAFAVGKESSYFTGMATQLSAMLSEGASK